MADDIYEAAGVLVPKQQLHEVNGEMKKVAEYIKDAKTLGELKISNPKKFEQVKKKLQKDFVVDALLGNRDVIGQDMDNILVKGAKVYRVDNGGSLRYRAQGDKKSFEADALVELNGLRNPSVNAQAAEIYGDLRDSDISRQITKVLKKESQILAAAKTVSIRHSLQTRMQTLKNWQKDYKATKGKSQKQFDFNIVKGDIQSGYPNSPSQMNSGVPKGIPKSITKNDWNYNSKVGDKIWKDHYTAEEKSAIKKWAGSSKEIQALDNKFGRGTYEKNKTNFYGNFVSALRKMPTHKGAMYRGMDGISQDQLRDIVTTKRYQNRYEHGTNSVHSSYSTDEKPAAEFAPIDPDGYKHSVILKVTKTKRAKHLMGVTKNHHSGFIKEREVVALPGAKYVVKHHKVFDPKPKKKMSAGTWAKKQSKKNPSYDIFKDTQVRHYIEMEEVWDYD